MKIEKAVEIVQALNSLNDLKLRSRAKLEICNSMIPDELLTRIQKACEIITAKYFAEEIKKAESKLRSL